MILVIVDLVHRIIKNDSLESFRGFLPTSSIGDAVLGLCQEVAPLAHSFLWDNLIEKRIQVSSSETSRYVMCVDIERMDVRMERMERRTLRQLQYSTCVIYKLS